MMRNIIVGTLLVCCLWVGAARAQSIQAGEAGVVIVWQPNATGAGNPISLTGLTVMMSYGIQGSAIKLVPCTVANDGLSASYTIVAGDFPKPGTYSLQFQASGGGGAIVRKSPIGSLTVRSNLGPTPTPTPGAP